MADRHWAEQQAREDQLNAWVDQAVRDGVARVLIPSYIACYRRQVFPKPQFSREPFSMLVSAMRTAYPERSDKDNSALALHLLHWTQRVHGAWYSREIGKPLDQE